MEEIVEKVLVFLVAVLVAFGFAALLALPTMWVVNYLFAPSFLTLVFGIVKITFWKAFWLNFITGWLFTRTRSDSK